MKELRIDAANQILGRLASRIALLLRGKDLAAFAPNLFPQRKIIVTGADKLKVTGDKMDQKLYTRHSGYPGGLKTLPLKEVFKRDPRRVLEWAVYGMLPKNRLRAKMMNNLVIYLSEKK
ncbi:MAG: 50S ribosomal protein L13 [Candidatus Portnoybacteria bacterium]|nr:50S ribosomal protein L13 [Candidatus Portnoybacteria bacterium]